MSATAAQIIAVFGLILGFVAAVLMYFFPARVIQYTEKGEGAITFVSAPSEEAKRTGCAQVFWSKTAPWLLAVSFLLQLPALLLVGSEQKTAPQVVAPKNTEVDSQRKPSVTELFHLRTECSKMGAKIMAESAIGPALTQDQVSHYDPKMNRCYVQLTVQSAKLSGETFSTYLYDGQTEEMLAYATKKEGKERVFMSMKKPTKTYEETMEYISSKIEDEDYYR